MGGKKADTKIEKRLKMFVSNRCECLTKYKDPSKWLKAGEYIKSEELLLEYTRAINNYFVGVYLLKN